VCLFVCLSVCLSVNTITRETLEISSQNFQGIILWSKGRISSKMAIKGCAGGDLTSLVFLMILCFMCGITCCVMLHAAEDCDHSGNCLYTVLSFTVYSQTPMHAL